MSRFLGIIGHENICQYLEQVLSEGRLGQAYLFHGPEHVGKTTVIDALLRDEVSVRHIDLPVDEKTGEQKTTISVESIREIRSFLQLSSFAGERNIVVIHHADAMTTAAQNALLKTLEEPKGRSLIILVASDKERLLETIQSRCVSLAFRLVPREIICGALQKETSKERAHVLAGYAAGRPGIAKKLLVSEAQAQFEEQLEGARQFLGASLAKRFKHIENVAKSNREERSTAVDAWRQVLHDCLLVHTQNAHLARQSGTIEALASSRSAHQWAQALQALSVAERAIHHNVSAQVALESFALELGL